MGPNTSSGNSPIADDTGPLTLVVFLRYVNYITAAILNVHYPIQQRYWTCITLYRPYKFRCGIRNPSYGRRKKFLFRTKFLFGKHTRPLTLVPGHHEFNETESINGIQWNGKYYHMIMIIEYYNNIKNNNVTIIVIMIIIFNNNILIIIIYPVWVVVLSGGYLEYTKTCIGEEKPRFLVWKEVGNMLETIPFLHWFLRFPLLMIFHNSWCSRT